MTSRSLKSTEPASAKALAKASTLAPVQATSSGFERDALFLKDDPLSAELVGEYAVNHFNQNHPELPRLEARALTFSAEVQQSEAFSQRLQKRLYELPKYIHAAPVSAASDSVSDSVLPASDASNDTSDDKRNRARAAVPFKDFLFWDQASVTLCVAVGLLLFPITMTSVVATLQTHAPIYLEQGWMAWMLAVLAPASSIVIKFGQSCFDSPITKHRYMQAICGLTGALVLIWMVLFAINFPGLTPSFDFASYGESSGQGKGMLLTLVQLMAEVLCSASLFLIAQAVIHKYQPDSSILNPAYRLAEQALTAHQQQHAALEQTYSAFMSQLTQLRCQRDNARIETITAYKAAHARRHHSNQF